MKCVICRHGETRPGRMAVLLTRGSMTLVVKGVPALVCGNCGEEYVNEETTRSLREAADEAEKAGVQVDVRQYVAA
ncbi:MAG: type II toxin-antitoxin system MqsA family antitoxin [Chloroflexi bacterium]|nr:type II toxin-antitoxin system MqsA family antitoxin [Chloroflexota bacterium]